jgi:hypothetical protein
MGEVEAATMGQPGKLVVRTIKPLRWKTEAEKKWPRAP